MSHSHDAGADPPPGGRPSWRLPLLVSLTAMAVAVVVIVAVDGDRSVGAPMTRDALRPQARAKPPGSIRLIRDAESTFANRFIRNPTSRDKRFMRRTYAEFRGYPPFHDRALRWGPQSHFYQDLYAIYDDHRIDGAPDRGTIARHPGWVLRDASGSPLFIPYACKGGSCPAFAADPGSQGWRRSFIRRARREQRKGYAGLFIDNVNMLMRVGNGFGSEVAPVDPRTGRTMTLAAWRRYVAGFLTQVERALPKLRITHNAIWYASRSNPSVRRGIAAADRIEIERGLSDPGLDDSGRFGYGAMLSYVDMLHRRGKSILSQPYSLDPARRRFELASMFLVYRPGDAIASDYGTDPGSYWPGWKVDLGRPEARRRRWGGLLRRDFSRGVSLVNPPGSAAATILLDRPMTDLEGDQVTTVRLESGSGAVLRGDPQVVGPIDRNG